jgi:hypothetical protein
MFAGSDGDIDSQLCFDLFEHCLEQGFFAFEVVVHRAASHSDLGCQFVNSDGIEPNSGETLSSRSEESVSGVCSSFELGWNVRSLVVSMTHLHVT